MNPQISRLLERWPKKESNQTHSIKVKKCANPDLHIMTFLLFINGILKRVGQHPFLVGANALLKAGNELLCFQGEPQWLCKMAPQMATESVTKGIDTFWKNSSLWLIACGVRHLKFEQGSAALLRSEAPRKMKKRLLCVLSRRSRTSSTAGCPQHGEERKNRGH